MLLLASLLAAACAATPVHTETNHLFGTLSQADWVAPSPHRLYGVMFSGRSVDGGFSVYVHGVNPVTHTNEKVMWLVPERARSMAGRTITLTWQRGRRHLVQRRHATSSEQTPGVLYPSILEPPATGCWWLRLRTGQITGRLRVLVQPQPSS